ncbi:MAG TPA: hypothetical protein VJ901_06205 [Thermoanaerobaculia bacterium]|nr:hypothetical protein [Thermoanaerobaculia bacterium]
MKRSLPLFAFVLLAACATTKPASMPVDPATDPTIIATVNDAAVQGSIEAAHGAVVGRNIGRVAGFVAAVFGGSDHECLDETIDRYRATRDAFTLAGAAIGYAHGAKEGGKRGLEVDQRFAELHAMQGLTLYRPYPDMIDVYLDDPALVKDVKAVFAGHQGWIIDAGASRDREQIVLHCQLGEFAP